MVNLRSIEPPEVVAIELNNAFSLDYYFWSKFLAMLAIHSCIVGVSQCLLF